MPDQPSNVVTFPNSKNASKLSKLRSVKCRMLRVDLSKLPPLARKSLELAEKRPAQAAVVEELLDGLLANVV